MCMMLKNKKGKEKNRIGKKVELLLWTEFLFLQNSYTETNPHCMLFGWGLLGSDEI